MDINKNLRTALGAMVVMDVHNRDTTEELATLGVRAQSRCNPLGFGGSQALEGKASTCRYPYRALRQSLDKPSHFHVIIGTVRDRTLFDQLLPDRFQILASSIG